jgi:hypothetical protein
VKRTIILIIVIVAVAGGGVIWTKKHGATADTAGGTEAKQPADEEGEGPHVTRDSTGNVVITMTDEVQGDLGILVKKPASFQMSPEIKGFGRVLDPAPMAALMTELASAQAAYNASSNELARLKILEGQGNASARAIQTAEAAAMHDLLALQSSKTRLMSSWGRAVSDRQDLPDLVQSLASLEAVLVRIDLPLGEALPTAPVGVRISRLSGQSCEADLLGSAPGMDPQFQGRGFFSLIKTNACGLSAGEAVSAFLKLPGEPVTGVIIPREAVVRVEGAGWVYVLNAAGDAFTRIPIPLDTPTEAGWFVTRGVTSNDYVVVTAAQQLLSIELKGQGGD